MSITKKIVIILGTGIFIAAIIGGIMFFKPKRDVQSTNTDFSYSASELVAEYLADPKSANNKYLDEEGNSKVLEITGTIAKISEDFNHQKVVLLKASADLAGVSCTFTPETNQNTIHLQVGDEITIKGVIRSGAAFDADLDMYENVILDQCDLIKK